MKRNDQNKTDQAPKTSHSLNTARDIFEIHLYVNGQTATAARVTARLQKLIEEYGQTNCHLKVIDVAEEPSLLEEKNILVIPTLLRLKPEPVSRVVGDMSDSCTLVDSLFPDKTHSLH